MNPKKTIIVEDDQAFIALIKLALRDMTFDLHVAIDGQTALAQIEKMKFDLIICDYRLPDATGIEIIKSAKEHNRDCEAILISAAAADMMNTSPDDLDLLGFLQKPFSHNALRQIVAQAF